MKTDNQRDREYKEGKNLFGDPKFARAAWRAVGQSLVSRPVSKPLPMLDDDGRETFNSMIQRYTYENLMNDVKSMQRDDTPTELEMILACQMLRARTDTAAATFVRDTVGAKPVDESKVDANVSNQYESMTDDELEALARYREERDKAKQETEQAKQDEVNTSNSPG